MDARGDIDLPIVWPGHPAGWLVQDRRCATRPILRPGQDRKTRCSRSGPTTLRLEASTRKSWSPKSPEDQGYSREPFDVGSLASEARTTHGVGQLAPDFRATTLDGRPIRLSDFRGKYLLIVFWSKTFRVRRQPGRVAEPEGLEEDLWKTWSLRHVGNQLR